MINKLYEKFKEFIKENYLWFLFYLVFIVTMTYPLPYYIYTGGGIIDVDDKIKINDATKSEGSFNMCYVSEINATIPTYLLSYIIPGWDMVSKEEIVLNKKESNNDLMIRNKIYLEEANQSAILTAYSNSNASYKILGNNFNVIYIEEDSDTDLKIGDVILKVDNKSINSLDDISDILNLKYVGDKISIIVRNNDKEYNRYAVVKEENNKKIFGIALLNLYDYETNPLVNFNFSSSESGPSGGLILSLALYDKLVSEDITKGLKISGTGTIDIDGNVGSIGGVKYKLKGAVDNNSDIFLVPNGENYEECIALKEKNNYDIKVIGVSTFDDAINYLRGL